MQAELRPGGAAKEVLMIMTVPCCAIPCSVDLVRVKQPPHRPKTDLGRVVLHCLQKLLLLPCAVRHGYAARGAYAGVRHDGVACNLVGRVHDHHPLAEPARMRGAGFCSPVELGADVEGWQGVAPGGERGWA